MKPLAKYFIYGNNILKFFGLNNYIYKSEFPIQHIIDNLYLGDFRAADNINILNENKITHIINCAFNLPNQFPNNFVYLRLELKDETSQELLIAAEKAYDFIKENSTGENKIFVHCVFGKSRSASIIIYYLMKDKGWSYEKALDYVKGIRVIAEPNEFFQNQLKEKESEFNKDIMEGKNDKENE